MTASNENSTALIMEYFFFSLQTARLTDLTAAPGSALGQPGQGTQHSLTKLWSARAFHVLKSIYFPLGI